MEKVEKKNKVVINGQEIEVPEGYEVVVEGERIKVVPKEDKETVKVVHAGEDIPESVVRTLKSVGLEFNEETMKKNVSAIGKAGFFIEMLFVIGVGIFFAITGIMFLMEGELFGGIGFTVMGSLAVIFGILYLTPFFD